MARGMNTKASCVLIAMVPAAELAGWVPGECSSTTGTTHRSRPSPTPRPSSPPPKRVKYIAQPPPNCKPVMLARNSTAPLKR